MAEHDRLFKELLTTFFGDFIALFLPEVLSYLDPATLVPLDKEVFNNVVPSRRREVDILMQANFREQAACFLLHLEHQSSKKTAFNRRMFRYFTRLHEKYGYAVYPIALFSYNRPQVAETNSYEVVFPDLDVLNFKYRVIQLNRLDWRDFANQPNPVASALMARMRIAEPDRPRVKLACLRMLAGLKLSQAHLELIADFVDFYLPLNEAEQTELEAELEEIEPAQEEEAVVAVLNVWVRRGIEQGREEGRREGTLTALLRHIQRRFGPLSEGQTEAVNELTLPQIEELDNTLFDMQQIEELEGWLQKINKFSSEVE